MKRMDFEKVIMMQRVTDWDLTMVILRDLYLVTKKHWDFEMEIY